MAQKKLSIPFLAILTVGLVATVVLGALITKQIKNKSISSVETTTPTVTATPPLTTSADTSPTTITQPKVPKPTYPAGWKEYHNEKYGYSYAYPEEIFAYGFSRPTSVAQYSYEDDGYEFEVTGFGVEGLEDFGRIKVTKKSIDELKAELLKKDIVSFEESAFNGYTATIVHSKNIAKTSKQITKLDIFIQNGDIVYAIDWYSGDVSELSYEAIGKQILATFHID